MSARATTDHRFPRGTFAPDPRGASPAKMLATQAAIEARLFLRHSEQQLLSLVIPLGSLIVLSMMPILKADHPVDLVFPLTLAIAAVSAGFTGQAIAVAFDRRYGALKRIGASGVARWTIIFGKVCGVLAVSAIQTALLGITAFALGWRTAPSHLPATAGVLIIGVMCFTALGLLMGGTLGSEVVLALANLVWFILIGMASYLQIQAIKLDTGAQWANIGPWADWTICVPSVALTRGITIALAGGLPFYEVLVLVVWGAIGALAATKLFRFTSS